MKIKVILEKNSEPVYALMRVVIGILFFSHGLQKAERILQGTFPMDNTLLLISGIIEFVSGLGIILGWKVFLFAFIASGEMAVGYFKSHQPKGFWPIDNGGEKAVFYCFLFLFIAAKGSGIWSLDNLLSKRYKGNKFKAYK
jgi:putative oxidoreductase